MKKSLLALLILAICSSFAYAVQLELIGGIRDGLALGIMGEQSAARNLNLRYGIEVDTGKQPVIAFIGGKFYLTTLRGGMPLSLGFGFVDYAGDKNSPGISLSMIFERAFDISPLFIEAGIDVADEGRLQLQVGYKVQ